MQIMISLLQVIRRHFTPAVPVICMYMASSLCTLYSYVIVVTQAEVHYLMCICSKPEVGQHLRVSPGLLLCSTFYLLCFIIKQCSIMLPITLNTMPTTTAIMPQFIYNFGLQSIVSIFNCYASYSIQCSYFCSMLCS